MFYQIKGKSRDKLRVGRLHHEKQAHELTLVYAHKQQIYDKVEGNMFLFVILVEVQLNLSPKIFQIQNKHV